MSQVARPSPAARSLGLAAALLLVAGSLWGHDLFIKLDSYFLAPGTRLLAPVLNGTFSSSENALEAERIADLSLVTPAGRRALEPGQVTAQNDTTFVGLTLGGPGTYALGLSTRPRELSLSGDQFAGYLAEEGLEEILEARRAAGTAGDSVTERYSKHVKAVFQVGERRTADATVPLGYPAELVPVDNPYGLGRGAGLRLRALVRGQPAAGVTVLAGGRTPGGARLPARRYRSDATGEVTIPLHRAGRWYAKFISMTPGSPGADYESLWATLTWEVR